MTNLTIAVTLWVQVLTNPVPSGVTTNGDNFYEVSSVSTIQQYLPDGAFLNASTMTHYAWVTNQTLPSTLQTAKSFQAPPIPPPISLRTLGIRAATAGYGPLVLSSASTVDTNCQCPMFAVSFVAKTNQIYGLERSLDMVNWELRPPEIGGEDAPERFQDPLEASAVYRVRSRTGTLP